MRLNKANWTKTKLTDICRVANGATPKGIENSGERGTYPFFRVNDMNLDGNEVYMHRSTTLLGEDDVKALKVKLHPAGTVIFPKRGASIHTNKKRLLSRTSSFDLNTMGLIPNEDIVPYFLFSWMQTLNLSLIADGSYIPQINNKNIAGISLHLPTVEEQKRIGNLFQAIDCLIESTIHQVANLRNIVRRVVGDLAEKSPSFGTLLHGELLPSFRFDEIAECVETHEREPHSAGLDRFVGLEHIGPEDLRIRRWGRIADGTTFTKTFTRGDVLFGKRRAYQRKVAVAEFDGLCSSDILVFRAVPNRILAELLPFYVSSEAFMQFAVNTSAGSLSPRTKWRDLAKFEVRIPDFDAQSKILDLLSDAELIIEDAKTQADNLRMLKDRLLVEILQ